MHMVHVAARRRCVKGLDVRDSFLWNLSSVAIVGNIDVAGLCIRVHAPQYAVCALITQVTPRV